MNEEPKQETLEEVAEKYENKDQHKRSALDFIEGAKWQQERMYNEKEVNDLLEMLKRSISEINHLKYTYKDKGHCGKYLSDCETIIEKFKNETK